MANLNKTQHLVFIEERGLNKYHKKTALYRCICGNEVVYQMTDVRNNVKTACGCMRFGDNNKGGFKHGFKNHPLYDTWQLMHKRCTNPTARGYENYGARGITICEEWRDVAKFIAWAEANGWQENLCIDRINTNGNYEPLNCRWSTVKENNNNRRNNLYITYKGETKTLQQWADLTGIKSHTLRKRIVVLGWSLDQAMML